MVGNQIRGITYVTIADTSEGIVKRAGFDEIRLGVELELDHQNRFCAAWVMGGVPRTSGRVRGDMQGLFVGPGTVHDLFPIVETTTEQVGVGVDWTGHLGSTVTDVTTVWCETERHGVLSMWAARIDFESADSVVVALGRAAGNDIEYHPTSVVVIFDESLARRYVPAASRLSAWGS